MAPLDFFQILIWWGFWGEILHVYLFFFFLFTAFSTEASDCRIGYGENGEGKKGMPFSGVTCVCDFCAHSHRDTNNVNGGLTVIVTLLKPENRGLTVEPDDEQLHGK